MPRDQRLYMTFPNDFWQHPKVELLSDAAFRAFVEMNGYSRMQDLDGRIPTGVVKRRWAGKAVAELVASHPDRPLVLLEGDEYVIRDYAQHQETRADRDHRRTQNQDNGRKGGRPRKNPTETDSVSETEPTRFPGRNRNETDSKAESESESEIEDLTKTHASQSLLVGGAESTDSFEISVTTKAQAHQLGVQLWPVAEKVRDATGLALDAFQTLQVSRWLLEKAKRWPTNTQGYVVKCVSNSPHEVAQFIHEQGMVA